MTVRPRVATVLTAREWEANLVTAARATSAIRLVTRAYEPGEVGRNVDVVVAGAETAWITPAFIKAWRHRGVRVLGLHPPGDGPAKSMLETALADEVRPDTTSSLDLVNLARALGLGEKPSTEAGQLIMVTGAYGAPGRTETAAALAHELTAHGSTLLMDLDTDAPSLSMRLGLPPSPDLADAEEAVTTTGELPSSVIQRLGNIDVLVGDLKRRPVSDALLCDVAQAAAQCADFVVVDTRAFQSRNLLLAVADAAVLVCDASPIGLIRGAEVALRWSGPAPQLVLNRVPDDTGDVLVAARRAIGLEPTAMIPELAAIRSASLLALPPPSQLRDGLASVAERFHTLEL